MSKKAFAQGLKKPSLEKYALVRTKGGITFPRPIREPLSRSEQDQQLLRALENAFKTARHAKTGV